MLTINIVMYVIVLLYFIFESTVFCIEYKDKQYKNKKK